MCVEGVGENESVTTVLVQNGRPIAPQAASTTALAIPSSVAMDMLAFCTELFDSVIFL
ncbi:hypothetical protein MNJPNG_22890 [Cupriavidus oxalaticus]